MNKKNKKAAAENIIWTVALIALLLVFLLIYSGIWSRLFGKGASSLNEQFNLAGDADNDGVINVADKCPCPPKTASEKRADDIENHGCPTGYKIDGSKKDYEGRWCFEKKNDQK